MQKNADINSGRANRSSAAHESREGAFGSRILRGGRLTKWKGRVATCAPHVAELLSCTALAAGARVLPLAVLAGLAASPAAAVDLYWDVNGGNPGQGGTGTWNLSNVFWNQASDGVAGPFRTWDNAALDAAIFAGTAGTVTLGEPITVGEITFNTNGYTLSGGTLTLGGATPTVTVNSGTSTINSVIAGTAGLTKAGVGTLFLTGDNTFSGGIILSAGTLRASDAAALGALSNSITTTGNAGFRIDSGDSTNRTVTIGAGTTLTLSGGATGSALYAGAGNVSIVSGVTMNNDASTYTGTTRFNGANQGNGNILFTSVRNLGEASSLGAPTTVADGTITFAGGSQYTDRITYTGSGDSSNRNWILVSGPTKRLINQGSGTLSLTGDIDITGSASFESGSAGFDLLGVISGAPSSVSFSAAAAGPITLGGANTYTGITGIAGGVVAAPVLADSGAASSLGAGTTINLSSNGVLSYTGAGDSSNRTWSANGAVGIRNDGTGALMLNGDLSFNPANPNPDSLTFGGTFAGTNTFSGVISGTGDLVSAGSSIWELSGANTRTGAITVEGGTLRAGTASAFGTVTGVTVNGGTLDLNGFDLETPTLAGNGGAVALGSATLTVDSATASSFAGSITGTGGLTKGGMGMLTLSGASTYTGDTTIGSGTLALDFSASGAPTDSIVAGASTLTMASGTLAVIGAASATNSQTFAGLNVTAGNNVIDASSGTGGSLTLNLGAITRTGGLMDFRLPDSGSITTSNADMVLGWATVDGTDYAKVEGGLILAFDEDDYTDKDDASTWQTGEVISDVDGFFDTVGATVQLAGLRYTVPTETTVTVAGGQTLGVDGTIIVAPSVDANDQTITGGAVTGATGGGTLGVQQNSAGNFIIGSQITDNGGSVDFSKSGTGLVTLTGNNTYTGATTLSGGTLSVGAIGSGGVASNIGASTADSENLVLQSGTLRYTGATDTTDRGFTLVNGGPSRTIEVTDGASNLTFTGLVTSPDDAGFTKSGAGTLTLANGGNDYVGPTLVTGGTLAVPTLVDGGSNSPIGASSSDSANLVLSNGGTLQYIEPAGTATSDRGFTLGTGGGGIDVDDASATLTLGGVATGAGGLTKSGAGTLVLSGTNDYTGGTTVDGGTLQAGSADAFGTGPMTVNTGATLDLNDVNTTTGALSGDGEVLLGTGILTINAGGGNFSGTISGTGGLTKAGGGLQTIAGCNNDYTGATTISGTLSVDCLADGNQPSGIGASPSDPANLALIGGRLTYTGGDVSVDRGFTLQGSNFINVTEGATTLQFGGDVLGAGNVRKEGAGTLVLSGNNTYTGGTVVDGGTLRAGVTDAFGTAAAAGGMTLRNIAGIALELDGFDTTVAFLNQGGANGGDIALDGATLTIRAGNSGATYSGVISGAGDLVKNGGAIQRLYATDSSYTGSTTINGGSLEVMSLADGGANSSIGASVADAGNLVINGGTLRYVGAGDSTDRAFTLGTAGGTLDASGTGAISFSGAAPIALAGADTARTLTLTGTGTADNRLAALIADNGTGATSLTKTNTGTWRLTNADSTYTGITTIVGGVLSVDTLADGGQASSIGAASGDAANLVIGNGSTLRYTGSGDTTDRLFTLATGVTFIESSGTGPIVFENTAPVTLSGTGARTIALGGTNTGLNTLGGTIADGAGGVTTLAKNGPGTWVLTGDNTYTGNTVINDGNLTVGNGGTTGNVGAGNVIVDSATSTLSINRSDAFDLTGTLSGPGTLAQVGAGTTVLTSAANAIGATTIGAGTLRVDGGLATQTIAMTGTSTLAVNGTVQATGATPAMVTGDAGASTINVNAGGILRAMGSLGGGSDSIALTGTLATGAGTLALGDGNDTLTLNDGAAISGGGVAAGAGTDLLQVNNAVAVALDGASVGGFESLEKLNTGVLTLTGNHTYSDGATVSAGTLQIGNGGTSGSLASDILNNGTVAFNRADTSTFAGQISGSGAVNQIGTGTTTLTGDNSYEGPTTVQSGTLVVNGDQTLADGLTTVANGGTLGGTGIVGGAVVVADGGTLSPGASPGTLTINGDLTLNAGSILDYEFGQADVVGGPLNDLIVVSGGLVLDGTLNVTQTPGGSFGPGIYRVISYAGTLTDNGLTLGTLPAGDYVVQTSIANQVNLVNITGVLLDFWDGAAGPANDGTVQGGNGVWRLADNEFWTTDTGTPNGSYQNATFAIFAGQAGTVTVDNANGQVQASGLQFATDGYVIDGGTLTLVGGAAIIRVGDGTSVATGMTATINAVVAGTSTLVKTDRGTLVLTGANTYSGGTRVEAGTLQVSSNANLGAAAGGLAFDGGTLQNTASFALPRAVTLEDGGGTFRTDASLILSGVIGGPGALTKTGAATLTLTGNNTYAGGTAINAGVLSVAGDGNLGAAAGGLAFDGGTLQNTASFASARAVTLEDGGGTFQTDADLVLSGVIGGTGALTKTGAETLTLTGNNTYAGGTTISTGTLQLGDGGSSGSLAGDVLNDGLLVFNRSDTYAFDGLISGGGAVEQIGAGTTILTGDNVYAGLTTVRAGSLLVNGDQSGATGLTTVASGGTLGGIGIIGGDAVVANGGAISPGDIGNVPGTLTINGSLSLGDGSALNYNFGQAGVVGGPFNDLLEVGGDLVLDGTLNVTQTPGGVFNPGIYRIIGYDGTLTNNGLSLGIVPAGDYRVQTSISNQVNLVDGTGVTLSFWDGQGGPADDGIIQGGDGVWRLADNNLWTDDTGTPNAPYSNGAFAIFAGQAGTVTVDNANGQVTAAGMQFAVDGYVIDGDVLTLAGGASIVRVGDGTADGTGMTATINSVLAGASTLVKADLGTLVLTGVNTYTGGTVIQEGTLQVAGDESLGRADGLLTLDRGTLRTTASFESGRDVALPSTGTFRTDDGTSLTLTGTLDGAGGFTKAGGGVLVLAGASSYGGATTVAEGTLAAGGTDVFSQASAFSVLADGAIDLAGLSQTVGSLANAGTVRLSGAPGTMLTVLANYAGGGGTIVLNTVLGDDGSATDRLVVGGDTSGSTNVRVVNVGGAGALTVEGIKIIDVTGASDGTFTLLGDFEFAGEPAVVAGAYAYRLYKGGVSTPGDGDWYLRTTDDSGGPLFQPGVPLYEAYAGTLQAFNRLGTLQQRVGNRSWIGRADATDPATAGIGAMDAATAGNEATGAGAPEHGAIDGKGIWARVEATYASIEPKVSTSGTDYDVRTWKIQFGIDTPLHESKAGSLIAGASVHYGTISSSVSSVHGDGKIDGRGYGLGATLTWFDENGLYVDGQVQGTLFESDLRSATAGRELASDNDGRGYVLSVEAGQRLALDGTWSLTPQAQLAYSSVRFDGFTDPFGANVSLDKSKSLIGRLGLAVDRKARWRDAQGHVSRSHLYGIANLYYDFADGSRVAVSGTRFSSENESLRGGIGLGGTVSWADDAYALYGEVLADTSLQELGDSNAVRGTVGFRVRW